MSYANKRTNPCTVAPAAATAAAARTPIVGEISLGSGELILPIKQEGSVVTHIHPDIHELTGSFQGLVTEFARLNVDADRGDGVFSADGDFGGTVLGSEPGTAKVKLRAQVADFHMLEGRFVITRGRDGLAGVRATGTWRYVFGEGGSYEGRAYITH